MRLGRRGVLASVASGAEARVMLAQDRDHLGPAEFVWHVGSLGEPLSQLRPRDAEPLAVLVRARACRRDAAAAVAPERLVDLERLRLERVLRDLVEDAVRVERPVVLAHAGVVAPDDLVRAAVVLAKEGVQQRLAWPGVAHVERIARLHDRLLDEIVLDQRGDGPRSHLGRYVAGLDRAEQR